MKFCPTCETEYRDEIQRCADCDSPLVSEAEMKNILAKRAAEAQEVFIKVGTIDNQFEADVVKSAFENENIPVMIRSFQDTAYDGIFIPQKGWGIVLVPTNYKEQAGELLATLQTTFKKASDQNIE